MLSVEVLGKSFENPLMNAAGVMCSTKEELDTIHASSAGAQITKSCTQHFRTGNPEPRYAKAPYGSINSMGLPNLGFAFYKEFAEGRAAAVAAAGGAVASKPLFFSISGLTLEESVTMARELSPLGARGDVVLELNLSCPNVPGKPQVGYDLVDTDKYLTEISKVYDAPFGVKLPPYLDMVIFDQVAEVLNRHEKVAFLTCINSVGNGLVIDVETEQVVIKPKDGFGGIGGHYVLPTALANVNAFFRRCPGKVIIGCGGVTSGAEAFQHILAGASLVQVGTQLYEEGPAVFDRLLAELRALMERKGYKSLKDFHGQLKTIA